MRVLVQRVSEAAVRINGAVIGEIGPGLLLLVGAREGDGPDEVAFLANKVANLRIFEDEDGKMNRSLLETELSALVVYQFTLYGDTRKGRRPSFVHAAPPEVASPLVDQFAQHLRDAGISVATGQFGAHMQVALVNDGPVTIWLDSEERRS